MYIDTVPDRNSRPAVLLRKAWREGKRIRKRPPADLSDWPEHQVESLRRLLRGERLVPAHALFQVERAFRCLKGVDLRVRPIFHRREDHVRAHAFLCVSA